MERQKAVEVARALDAVDSYGIFIDQFWDFLDDIERDGICAFSVEFKESLKDLLEYEQKRREKILEDL